MEIHSLNSENLPPFQRKGLTFTKKCATLDESAGSAADSLLVTDIKQAIKNPNRANIFINNKYSFSLDISQLSDNPLKIGQTLTAPELDHFKKLSSLGKLYARALEYALTRPRSEKEVRDYLLRKIKLGASAGYPAGHGRGLAAAARNDGPAERDPAIAPSLISDAPRVGMLGDRDIEFIAVHLREKNYLNDLNFAKYYLENRFTKKGISKKRLVLELRKKGVAPEIIAEALSDSPRDDQTEIKKLVAKKRNKYATPEKLIQYLVRQGFPYELARNSVRETDSQNWAQSPSPEPPF
jgi:regulatory protein